MPLSFFQEVDSVIYGEPFPNHGYWHWQRRGRNVPRSLEFHDKKTMPKTEATASETVGFFLPFEFLHHRHEPLDQKRIFDPKIAKLRRLKVTLKELKKGAYKHVTHVRGSPPKSFGDMFASPLFDVMLYRLIQYMEAEERLKEFVDEQTREALRQRALKKQGILNAPPAIGAFDQIKHDETEAKLKNKIADICARIGEIYGGFLIGLRMETKFHHMQKGKTFFSNKKLETDMFEFLYVFLTQFIWLLYDCRDSKLLTIRRKVTEIFRTEMFNFGARKIHAKSTYGDVIAGVVSRHPDEQWAPPQRELEEEWTRRPRKKLLAANSIAVKHYAEKLLDKTKDEMKRLDIFADDAPPLDSTISIQRHSPSEELLRCLATEMKGVGILGSPLFAFDPQTMKRLKKKTRSPERMLYSYLDEQPKRDTVMTFNSDDQKSNEGTEEMEPATDAARETGVRFEKAEAEKTSKPGLEGVKRKASKRSFISAKSATSSEKDFIGNEELSRKNIEELENKIDLFHRSVREIRTKRVPGANMETTLTKNGFVLPIFNDEVVTKQLEDEEKETDPIIPPKHFEVSGDPVRVEMTDGRQFALWRRKEWKAPKRCPKTGKVID